MCKFTRACVHALTRACTSAHMYAHVISKELGQTLSMERGARGESGPSDAQKKISLVVNPVDSSASRPLVFPKRRIFWWLAQCLTLQPEYHGCFCTMRQGISMNPKGVISYVAGATLPISRTLVGNRVPGVQPLQKSLVASMVRFWCSLHTTGSYNRIIQQDTTRHPAVMDFFCLFEIIQRPRIWSGATRNGLKR